jgi:hypothetical protein
MGPAFPLSGSRLSLELLALSPSIVRLLHEAEMDGESWMQSDGEEPTR